LPEGPADDPPAVKIQDGRQIDWSSCARDVGDIRYPNPVRPAGQRQIAQAIGRDGMLMVAIGRPHPVTAPLPSAYGRFTHQPTQTVSAVSLALGTEAGLDTRTAVGLAALLVNAS